MQAYFRFEVANSDISQKVQQREFNLSISRKLVWTKNVLIHQAAEFQTIL